MVLREIQMKTAVRYLYTAIRMAKTKRTLISGDKGAEQAESSHPGEGVKC